MRNNCVRRRPVWLQLLYLKGIAPVLFWTLVMLFLLEICGFAAGNLLIGDTWYLSWYLSSGAENATKRFLRKQALLIPDNIVGWRNKPSVKKQKWVIDKHGSRSTGTFTAHPVKPIRVLLLGSSMINGGTDVTNYETISAFLEDDDIEALNFGTMMYSVDQSLLAYQNYLCKYKEKILIVGLDVDPVSGLKNHYIPLRFPREKNMPYLKPRFELHARSLRLIDVCVEALLKKVPDNLELLEFLSENDGFYYKFESYRLMGFLPLGRCARFVYLEFLNIMRYFRKNVHGDRLLQTIMTKIVKEAKERQTEVIFLTLPNKKVLTRSSIHRFLPDLYGRRVRELRSRGFNIIDVRQTFRQSAKPANELFEADQEHYSPLGNRVIANAVRPIVKKISSKRLLQASQKKRLLASN